MNKTSARFLRYINKNFGSEYENTINKKHTEFLKSLLKKYYFYDFSSTFDMLEQNADLQGINGNVAHDIEIVLNEILCNRVNTIVNCLLYDLEQRGVV